MTSEIVVNKLFKTKLRQNKNKQKKWNKKLRKTNESAVRPVNIQLNSDHIFMKKITQLL